MGRILLGRVSVFPSFGGYLGETTYCFQQEARLARQAETLPQGQISENFSPMIIGLNASIFTPGKIATYKWMSYNLHVSNGGEKNI